MVLGASGAGWCFYQRPGDNIHGVPIGDRGGGAERPDASGRTPVDILVTGSDGRTSAADCRRGGGCAHTGVRSGGGNADVERVVRIAADRSHATVMSIPRDTVTGIPACRSSATDASEPGYRGSTAHLGAVLRKLESGGTLSDPAAVYRLADAATKALTVDDGLGSVPTTCPRYLARLVFRSLPPAVLPSDSNSRNRPPPSSRTPSATTTGPPAAFSGRPAVPGADTLLAITTGHHRAGFLGEPATVETRAHQYGGQRATEPPVRHR